MDVLNRTTKEFLESVNTPDYPLIDWIHDPDLSSVIGWDSKYWLITGDIVSLMSEAERDAVDASEAAQLVIDNRTDAVSQIDESTSIGVHQRAMIELLNKRDNYIINRITELQNALDAIKASTGPADNIRAALPVSWLATATRDKPTAVQAYKDDINAGVND